MAGRVIPEMVVRVDDRQIGLEDLLGQFGEPCKVRQRARIGAGFANGWGAWHAPGTEANATPLITGGAYGKL